MISFHSHCLTVLTCLVTPIENQIHYLWVANLLFRSFARAEFLQRIFCENREDNELLLFYCMSFVAEFVKYLKKTENFK